jgi:hypothetical protein
MQELGCQENYPISIVIGSNLLSFLIYGIGAYILFKFSILLVICYVIFIVTLEFRLLSGHCVDCYYYGKTCAFGKGRLSSIFFQKGNPETFKQMTITWKDIIPDFLAFMIPVLAGILLLIQEFSWSVLILILALLRGHLACRYCKQGEVGCPAAQLFDKTKKP